MIYAYGSTQDLHEVINLYIYTITSTAWGHFFSHEVRGTPVWPWPVIQLQIKTYRLSASRSRNCHARYRRTENIST